MRSLSCSVAIAIESSTSSFAQKGPVRSSSWPGATRCPRLPPATESLGAERSEQFKGGKGAPQHRTRLGAEDSLDHGGVHRSEIHVVHQVAVCIQLAERRLLSVEHAAFDR